MSAARQTILAALLLLLGTPLLAFYLRVVTRYVPETEASLPEIRTPFDGGCP